jgi:hypothetical protein
VRLLLREALDERGADRHGRATALAMWASDSPRMATASSTGAPDRGGRSGHCRAAAAAASQGRRGSNGARDRPASRRAGSLGQAPEDGPKHHRGSIAGLFARLPPALRRQCLSAIGSAPPAKLFVHALTETPPCRPRARTPHAVVLAGGRRACVGVPGMQSRGQGRSVALHRRVA